MKEISVAILNWNGVELLQKFLGSVVEHTPADLCDVVVIDNGSTDSSTEYIAATYPSVRIVQLDQNYGFTGGYNRGIEQLDSKYVILLNSDVEVKEDWVTPLYDVIQSDSNIAVVTPKILSQREPHLFEYAGASGGFIDKYGLPFCRGRVINTIEEDRGQYDDQCEIFWASGAAMMIRRELYLSSRGLDEAFFAHQEEIDLCWRLRNMGYKIVVVPKSRVFHLGGATLDYKSPRKLMLNHRNSLYMIHKNTHSQKYKRIIFQRMVLDGVLAIVYLMMFNIKGFWAVTTAHKQYKNHCSVLDLQREYNITKSCNIQPDKCVYKGSIIDSYIIGRRTFDKIFRNDR